MKAFGRFDEIVIFNFRREILKFADLVPLWPTYMDGMTGDALFLMLDFQRDSHNDSLAKFHGFLTEGIFKWTLIFRC